jgi:hypothetical protein
VAFDMTVGSADSDKGRLDCKNGISLLPYMSTFRPTGTCDANDAPAPRISSTTSPLTSTKLDTSGTSAQGSPTQPGEQSKKNNAGVIYGGSMLRAGQNFCPLLRTLLPDNWPANILHIYRFLFEQSVLPLFLSLPSQQSH